VRALTRLDADAEITLEANPGTFEKDRFRAFRQAGVTRLSIGVQSFHDAHLKALGRVHDRAQALAAVEEAARSFDTFNLDVMYALPGQTLAQAEQDMRTALSLSPPHISIYHLTLEPNTYFAKFPPVVPDDDDAYAMLDRITELTAAAGLSRYEVSAYARPGHACRHNLNYWQFGDYLGIGAGAHGKISSHEGVVREMRYKQPAAYLQAIADGNPVQSRHKVGRKELPFEFMMNTLRLTGGFETRLFSERTGLPVSCIQSQLQQARAEGLIEQDPTHLRPTLKGQRFLNDLLTLFLHEEGEN